MDVQWLLDEAKRKTGVPSDLKLAERLGVTRQAVSFWRRGRALPDVVSCEKLADFCDLPPLKVVAEINELRAATHAEKQLWRRLAAAIFAGIVIVLPSAQAATDSTNGSFQPTNGRAELCIMRNFLNADTIARPPPTRL